MDRRPAVEYTSPATSKREKKNPTLMSSVESGSAGGHITRVVVLASVLSPPYPFVITHSSFVVSFFTAYLAIHVKRQLD